jgi:hypothetical protein
MGKRQVRIFRQDLALRLPETLHREVHLILTGNRVFKGTVSGFSDVSLCILDGRRREHNLPMAEIEELVYDLETLR